MHNTIKSIISIINLLESKNLLIFLEKVKVPHDDPQIHQYRTLLKYSKRLSDGIIPLSRVQIASSGSSFEDKYLALYKCLIESIERFSLFCFKKNSIIFSSRYNLKEETLNLKIYLKNNSINSEKFGWVKGFNLTKNIPCWVPAQLVYLNFLDTFHEKPLSTIISTGAAGGSSHEDTLLNGIYEIAERDAFMTTYLCQIKSPLVKLENIENNIIKSLVDSFKKYNLELYVFDITNDLRIPSFLSVIIDRTSLGPAISVGAKSSLNIPEAILGSIAEALVCRIWIRWEIYRKKSDFKIEPNKIKTQLDRGFFWTPTKMIKKLGWLTNQPSINNKSHLRCSNINELKKVQEILERKGLEIYYVDITPEIFKSLNHQIYRVIIPKLQPLYLNESQKEISINRLKTVAENFGKTGFTINSIPHPFL